MILSERTKELILAMCDRYEQGMFVDGSYLRELNVSSSENAVFDTVTILLRGICRIPDSEVMKLIALGAGTPGKVAYDLFSSMRLNELSEEISAFADGRLSSDETNAG